MWLFAGLYLRVLFVGLLLGSAVLAGDGVPERKYPEKSRDNAMALQSKVWWLFAGPIGDREYQVRESPDSPYSLHPEPESRGKSGENRGAGSGGSGKDSRTTTCGARLTAVVSPASDPGKPAQTA